MKYSYNLSGANQQLIKEFDIAPDTVIKKGQPVTLEGNEIIGISNTVSTPIGVAEEDHSGVKEELNARSNGTKIRVSMSPTAVYTAKLTTFKISDPGMGSFATTIGEVGESFLRDHKIIYVEKAKTSAAMQPIGTIATVLSANVSGSKITVQTDCDDIYFDQDDIYMVIPHIGDKIACDVSGEYFCPKTPNDSEAFVCVGVDVDNKTIDAKVFDSCFNK